MIKEEKRKKGRPRSNQTLEERLKRLEKMLNDIIIKKEKLKNMNSQKQTIYEFIGKSEKIHKNKYDYSQFKYKNCKIKSIIVCNKHGEFLQSVECHLRGQGCPKCKFELLSLLFKGNKNDFIKKSKLVHKNKYNYSNVNYINARIKVKIICPMHGEFLQVPQHHINKIGCPKCHSSKGELKIQKWLLNNNMIFEFQKKFNNCRNPKTNRKLTFDFYIPFNNLLIEYDGQQHFKSNCYIGKYKTTKKDLKETIFKDKIKNDYAKQNKIKLLRIKYNQIGNIDDLLTDVF